MPLWDKVKLRALTVHKHVKYNIMVKQGNTWNLSPIQHEGVWSNDPMILDISEYFAKWQDTMNTLLKSKMSTQLLPYKDLKSQHNGSPVKKEDLKSQQHGSPVKEKPTEASACTKLLEDRSSYWSPRSNRKQQPLPYGLISSHPSAKQHNFNKVKYHNNSTMKKSPRKSQGNVTHWFSNGPSTG